jgi:hypothetical protein
MSIRVKEVAYQVLNLSMRSESNAIFKNLFEPAEEVVDSKNDCNNPSAKSSIIDMVLWSINRLLEKERMLV